MDLNHPKNIPKYPFSAQLTFGSWQFSCFVILVPEKAQFDSWKSLNTENEVPENNKKISDDFKARSEAARPDADARDDVRRRRRPHRRLQPQISRPALDHERGQTEQPHEHSYIRG